MVTLRFLVVGAATEVTLRPAAGKGQYTVTRILDGFDSSDVTGALRAARISVPLCGVPGDLDGDCFVDAADYGDFHACLGGPGAPPPGGCGSADLDGDADVDLRDAAVLLCDYTGY